MRSMTMGREMILGEKAARFSKVGLARRCGSGRLRLVGFIYIWSVSSVSFILDWRLSSSVVTYIYPLSSAIR